MAKTEEPDYLGIIFLDIFNIQIGVFDCVHKRQNALKKMGVDSGLTTEVACYAFAAWDADELNRTIYSLYLGPESTITTWAHECVHLADMIMDRAGIPTEASNTEIRAYITGHLLAQIMALLNVKNMAYPTKKPSKKKKPKK